MAETREAAGARPRSHFNLPPPEAMNTENGILVDNWRYFEDDWRSWAIATKLDTEAKPSILAALKRVVGREAREVLSNLPIVQPDDPEALMTALRTYFIPKKNITYERYLFNTATQGEDCIDRYVTRLRKLAVSCEFGELG